MLQGAHILIVDDERTTRRSLSEIFTLRGAITNAHIKLKSYAGEFQKGTNLLTVCGTTERKGTYDCAPAVERK